MKRINETLIRQLVNEALDEIELEKGDNCWEKIKPESSESPFADGEDETCDMDGMCCDGGDCCCREDMPEHGDARVTIISSEPDENEIHDNIHGLLGKLTSSFENPISHDDLDDKADLFDRLMNEAKNDYRNWING